MWGKNVIVLHLVAKVKGECTEDVVWWDGKFKANLI